MLYESGVPFLPKLVMKFYPKKPNRRKVLAKKKMVFTRLTIDFEIIDATSHALKDARKVTRHCSTYNVARPTFS
jgi:hypothetical protein